VIRDDGRRSGARRSARADRGEKDLAGCKTGHVEDDLTTWIV
jgi:hypothetical protein